jgi:VIT1/CCC1 family predicted Fe2+/Mn2+ transporter
MSSIGDSTRSESSLSKAAGMAPGVIGDAKERVSSAAKSTEDQLRHLAEKSRQDLIKSKDKTKETMASALQCAKVATVRHPFLVAGAALALGGLAAILYRHK